MSRGVPTSRSPLAGPVKPTARDLVAGVTVALVLVPQSMAYAELAGLPAYRGLYAAAVPPIAAAFFASSPYLQTGPVALTSLLTLGALLELAPAGTAEFVGLAAVLALVVGITRVALGVVRAGVVAYLLSEPLLVGFTSAAAILIVASQLPGAFGVSPPVEGLLPAALWTVISPRSWEVASLALAVGTIGVTVAARKAHPLIPGALIAAVLGIAYSRFSGYQGEIIGPLPAGVPLLSFELPWSSLSRLVLPGFIIALVGFAEPASIARTFAARERKIWNPDQEFVSQGVANIASGLVGGFPVGGSFSRSSLNWDAGAKTRWSGAITGLVVLAILPIANILSPLPRAVLSALVIGAVFGLIKLKPLLTLWQLSKPQFLVAGLTFFLTLALAPHVEQALVLGILLAVALHLWREIPLNLRSWTEGDTLHLELRGVLWFGSAPGVEEGFLRILVGHQNARRLVLHLGGLGRIDLTGALVLRALLADAKAAGLETQLADVPPQAERLLRRALGWQPADETLGVSVDLDGTRPRTQAKGT
jgi:sulfate permease, SulP family